MTTLCVIDDGSSQIKLRTANGETTIKFPSIAVNRCVWTHDGKSASAYTIDGLDFTVLPFDDSPERTDTSNYQVSMLDRVFVHEALRRAGLAGQEVILGVTLPINQYFELGQGAAINHARIEAKKANIMGPIENAKGEPLAIIKDVTVFPEAIPASVDMMTVLDNGTLNFKPEYAENKRVCCIDAGGHSVDIVLFESITGNIIAQECIESGVIKILDTLQSKLAAHFGQTTPIERSVAANSLITKECDGQDISNIIDEITLPFAEKVRQAVERLANLRSTNLFLVVGGGASLIESKIKEYAPGKTIVPAEADESIARGIGKMLVAREKKAQASTEVEAV